MKLITRVIIGLAVMAVFGIYCLITSAADSSELAKAVDFNGLTERDFYKGQIVNGYVYEVYGKFAYEEEYDENFGVKRNQRVSAHYYLIPLADSLDDESGDLKLVAVKMHSAGGVSDAEKLMEQTYAYHGDGVEPDEWNEFRFSGKVSRLDKELEGYVYDWFTDDGTNGTRADYEKYVCPYLLTEFSPDSVKRGTTMGVIMLLIGGGGLAAVVIIYVSKNKTVTPPQSPAQYGGGYPTGETQYNPVMGSGRMSSSGSIPSPADGGESERLMKEMESIPQPPDPDDFFNATLTKKDNEDKGLGIGIDDK